MSSPTSFLGSQHQLNSQEINSVINSGVRFTSLVPRPAALSLEKDDVPLCANDFLGPTIEKKEVVEELDDCKVSPIIEKIETKKQRRRSVRRMSVHEAVSELDRTSLIAQLNSQNAGEELDKHSIPCLDNETDNVNSDDKGGKDVRKSTEKVKEGKGGVKRRQSGLVDIDTDSRVGKRKSRRSSIYRVKKEMNTGVTAEPHNNERSELIENKDKSVETEKDTAQSKEKKTMKKKLMSLTDLLDRRSQLLEPTQCSQVERSELNPGKGKKRRKKAAGTNAGNDLDNQNRGKENEVENDKNTENNSDDENENECDNKTTKTGKQTSSSKVSRLEPSKKKGRKKSSDNPTKNVSGKKEKGKALVNETVSEEQVLNGSQNPPRVTTIQDITTQLNLTKDNSIACSIRETTLSMSMSRAYSDVPSILHSSRRSVDEFNLSQQGVQKSQKKRAGKRKLSTVDEGGSMKSSSESENSISGKRARLNHSGHRKLQRPSIVMTSLHSQ